MDVSRLEGRAVAESSGGHIEVGGLSGGRVERWTYRGWRVERWRW